MTMIEHQNQTNRRLSRLSVCGTLAFYGIVTMIPISPAYAQLNNILDQEIYQGDVGVSVDSEQYMRCTIHYYDGTTEPVGSCDNYQCPDRATEDACDGLLGEGDCNLVASCDCSYEITEYDATTVWDDEVRLTGVLNAWQFAYGCGLGGDNAVGCGPVASAMMLYWWAQQGYDALVEDFTVGTGTGPSAQTNDWQELVRVLRDDYLDDGFCVPVSGGGISFSGQYAVTQEGLARGLRDYIADAGYQAQVEHYRVCDSCLAAGAYDLTTFTGLELIKSELYAGRPVIIGFGSASALGSTIDLFDPELNDTVEVSSGQLSNGTPVLGIIDHYAVITGYRQLEGLDVLTVNLGWGKDRNGTNSTVDQLMLWNPGGKWAHLYTVTIQEFPEGFDWCAIDRGLGNAFTQSAKLELSHANLVANVPLAGSWCGSVRASTQENIPVETYSPGFTCHFGLTAPEIDGPGKLPGGTTYDDPRGTGDDGWILDQLGSDPDY